ncbi:single-stranded-DNA-specific exonuclease RecJ [Olsenella phocaeensis]|nr:single-stranded-DNA-specific exonuclease RecJ [Olsenella phocaeensis]
MGSRRWELCAPNPALERELSSQLGLVPLVARVMAARGVASVDEARAFLTPSLVRDWCDPLLVPGMADAAGRIERAVRTGQTVAIFGDFDVDGMSATALLTLGLRELGAEVHPYIPHRFGEGYGLSREALGRVIEGCDPDLVVTVDNGIAAREEVAWLVGQGVDVVVTDHHEPAELVPEGVPVTDPKLADDCPSRELAGAGVALKLLQELGRRLGAPDLWRSYTEVATLGTVSDMMLLSGENRALVADGISRMREAARPGIVALAATARVDVTTITSDQLPFSLVPRLNAAGRMGTTDVAFELLLTDDLERAQQLAARLEQVNSERREIEAQLTEEAMAKVDSSFDGGRVVVVSGEGWHEGVKGIVASRMTNRYHVPAIVFSISDGIARGSGRSVGSVDLFRAVEQCSDLLVRFGGHAGAVGVTCDVANLDAFRVRLGEVMAELPDSQFEDRGEVCALVDLAEMTVPNIEALETLQPFGQGNKKPLLGVRGVSMRNRARVGSDGSHLRFVATDGMSSVPAIMFRAPDIERANDCDAAVDLVFEPVAETWQGRTKPKLMVKDILYRDEPEPAREGEAGVAEELFSHASEVLSRDEFAGIAEAQGFVTKLMGVSFAGRQELVRGLVTATAQAGVARELCRLLSIDERDVVVDASVRDNLRVRDCRELRDRDSALVSVVATGMKTVVYVNSREQSVSLARMLRKAVPELARRIAFYNAGLTRADRGRVEDAFRAGELKCIVSTSAFGEGVNLPDIRNVMLYHMPFGSIEFNQMSGRAGRDGQDACVWLLFGGRDARINERILAASAPERSELVTLYRVLRELADGQAAATGLRLTNADLAQEALLRHPASQLDERAVSCGISVFRELGFLSTDGYGSARRITMAQSPSHVQLDRSIRYLEGLRLRDEFQAFRDWALSSSPQELLDRINRPITPGFGDVVDG